MRHVHALVLLVTTLGLSTLNCGGDEGTLPATAGTSGSRGHTPSGAGMSNVTAGAGGTAPGAVGSNAGRGSGGATAGGLGVAGASASTGGAPPLGAGGSSGSLASAGSTNAGGGGLPTGGAPGGLAGAAGAGAAAGAGTTAGAPGSAGAGQSMGGGAGSAAVGPCGAVTGASFAQVAAIITTSCGTKDCHPNDKQMHTDLHNNDGKLLTRLLGNAPVSVKTECQNRPLVVPCSPDTSLIMQKLGANEAAWAGCGKQMPDDCPDERPCLSAADIETIRSWIAAGALP